MPRVTIFSTASCPLCTKAKSLFSKWNINYHECRVDIDQACLKEMLNVSNHARNVPQIVIDDKWIGGFTELTELHMDGALDNLVNN